MQRTHSSQDNLEEEEEIWKIQNYWISRLIIKLQQLRKCGIGVRIDKHLMEYYRVQKQTHAYMET